MRGIKGCLPNPFAMNRAPGQQSLVIFNTGGVEGGDKG